MRIIPAQEGKVFIDGKDFFSLKGKELFQMRSTIQIVMQDAAGSLNPRLTIFDIVQEGLKIHYPKLNKQDVKTIYILVPPLSEQKEIIEFLDNKCKEIDLIIYKQKESLETLKRYKQSLIYEYVTGKKRVV